MANSQRRKGLAGIREAAALVEALGLGQAVPTLNNSAGLPDLMVSLRKPAPFQDRTYIDFEVKNQDRLRLAWFEQAQANARTDWGALAGLMAKLPGLGWWWALPVNEDLARLLA